MIGDLINGTFESLGSIFILFSIIKLHKEKQVKGVDYKHIAFFTIWGIWNLYYYPSLNQRLSFIGGILIVIANVVWVSQIIYYSRVNREGRCKKTVKENT
jgi:ABC-type transport system involved in cytochrome c biogenesis permease subunit